MSHGAIVFMILTMGGVLGLNVLCIVLWIRRGSGPAPTASAAASAGDAAKPSTP